MDVQMRYPMLFCGEWWMPFVVPSMIAAAEAMTIGNVTLLADIAAVAG